MHDPPPLFLPDLLLSDVLYPGYLGGICSGADESFPVIPVLTGDTACFLADKIAMRADDVLADTRGLCTEKFQEAGRLGNARLPNSDAHIDPVLISEWKRLAVTLA